jgi:hypothetical protein
MPPDRRLRAILLVALVLLALPVSMLVIADRSPGSVPSVAPHEPRHDTGGSHSPTTSMRNAVVAPTDPNRADNGCGFSLDTGTALAPVGHCTVLEIGDSLGNDLGWGLARELPTGSGVELTQLDKSSTGLANSSFYDWPTQLATDLNLYHPQLVIVCLGGNDEQGMTVDGSVVQFSTTAWESAYLARVEQLIDEATAHGAFVLWVGLPIMQQPSYGQGVEILNSIYQQAVASHSKASFVSTWSLLANPEGEYEPTAIVNGAPATLREPDGIHYSLSGENVIATYVLEEIASIYHVQLLPDSPAMITGW